MYICIYGYMGIWILFYECLLVLYIYIYIDITVYHMPNCMRCYKPIAVITEGAHRTHYFHDDIYIIYIYIIYNMHVYNYCYI